MTTILDNHGRPITYLRLAVTDRCNLRCFYCMPEQGIRYLPKKDVLTFEEIQRLISLLASMGITKVRLTGGEPFVRNDLMKLIRGITKIQGIEELHLTTNGVLTGKHIPELKQLGLASVNLSLDTLDKQRFHAITRRDEFEPVMNTLNLLMEHQMPVKINAVVMDGKNIEDILPLVELTRLNKIDVRFIEEMPFNGEGNHYPTLHWTYKKILEYIKGHYPEIIKIPDPVSSTSSNYQIPGHMGNLGIIAAFSRTFCGTCNRIRVTAQGMLKTCLYDDGVLDIRQLLRADLKDDALKVKLLSAFQNRAKDGFEAEASRKNKIPVSESMSTIGG
ncbi:MAG: GTP 3',8-cyclase MoaA [Cyclobacteriaceae bacterium]|nr:GTP 3',8-cyclase MoaA [Cyclobacteriaceae bacterium]MDH4297855.1 GTP 3',8-cyclase MoaA [Cyclobacteriaceae bacterium]MDH5248018.1 GTP 3',8-cyclase MoaA [Cyclobacteriaceae bacterium]